MEEELIYTEPAATSTPTPTPTATPTAGSEAATDLTTLMAEAMTKLRELIDIGGPVMLLLLVLSVVTLAVIIMKWWQFARLQVRSRRAAERALALWLQGQHSNALKRLRRSRNPVARVVYMALHGLNQNWPSEDKLREEVTRVAMSQLENLRSHLRILEVIAALSPLLGLLGTILGMIEAFQQLEQAGNRVDPAILSGGIWQALLTTAAGLAVAIPAVIALNWFERRVERCAHAMEDITTRAFIRSALIVGSGEVRTESHSVSTAQSNHAY